MKKVLVTGGTGFIGSHLVRRLAHDGLDVRVFDNDSRGRSTRLDDIKSDIEIVTGDIRDSSKVEKAAKGCDAVFHLAYVNGTKFFYSQPELVLDVGVRGMISVLDACLKNEIGTMVLASSSEVYQTPPSVPTKEDVPLLVPDPLNPRYSYGGGKIISELMALNYGRKHFEKVLIFRPHNVYGPDMGWEHVIPEFAVRMKKLSEKAKGEIEFPIQGNGTETRAFVYVSDFIDGVSLMVEKGEHLGIYHIGTQDEKTIADLAHAVAASLDLRIKLAHGPLQKGGTLRRCPDISKMKALGYAPKVSLKEGVAKSVKWYAEHWEECPPLASEHGVKKAG